MSLSLEERQSLIFKLYHEQLGGRDTSREARDRVFDALSDFSDADLVDAMAVAKAADAETARTRSALRLR